MLKKLLENSMSKEREMIEKLCSFQMTYSDWLLLIADAEELLAQPEQEPVAWMVETHFNNEPIKEIHTVKPMERVYKYCKVTELYATPLKPLTGIEISKGFKADDEATHLYSYWAGVEFAEKHHGIGGGCDE
jgi:hypothetical protein